MNRMNVSAPGKHFKKQMNSSHIDSGTQAATTKASMHNLQATYKNTMNTNSIPDSSQFAQRHRESSDALDNGVKEISPSPPFTPSLASIFQHVITPEFQPLSHPMSPNAEPINVEQSSDSVLFAGTDQIQLEDMDDIVPYDNNPDAPPEDANARHPIQLELAHGIDLTQETTHDYADCVLLDASLQK